MDPEKLNKFISDMCALLSYLKPKKKVVFKTKVDLRKQKRKYKSKEDVLVEMERRKMRGLSTFSNEIWRGVNCDKVLWHAVKKYGLEFAKREKCKWGHDITKPGATYKKKRGVKYYYSCRICRKSSRWKIAQDKK